MENKPRYRIWIFDPKKVKILNHPDVIAIGNGWAVLLPKSQSK